MNDSSDDVPYRPGCLPGWDLQVGPAAPTSEDSTSSTTSGSEGGMEDRSDDVRYRPGYVPPTPNELLSDSDPETSEEDSEESSLDGRHVKIYSGESAGSMGEKIFVAVFGGHVP